MKTLREKLEAAANAVGVTTARIYFFFRRWKANHRIAERAKRRAERAEVAADRARANDHPRRARRKDREANRHRARQQKYQGKAQYWIARIKHAKVKRAGQQQTVEQIERELEQWRKEHRLDVQPNRDRVTGGTPKARFRAACLLSAARCASGKRRNFYSQPGAWTVGEVFTGEEYGERSDCSQWLTSVCKAAGLPDPNGTDWSSGYTGTLIGEHGGWHQTTEAKMRERGFGYVVYGTGTGFHVEAYVGPGDKTIGHGSAPIDAGVIDLLGNGDYRCYVLD